MGNRIAASANGVEKRYVLDLNNRMSRVIAETDNAGNITARYVYGLGLISRFDPGNNQHRFYHFNHRGDTVALSDTNGIITDRYAYDAYGQMVSDAANTTIQPFKFIGKYGVMEDSSSFYFMRARYYDAQVGKFLSEDPLGFEGGDWNTYSYATNNPIMKIDFTPYFEKYQTIVKQADELFERVQKEHPECVTCKTKCADCCHALFDLSLIEAIYINYQFKKTVKGKEKSRLIEKANHADRKTHRIKRQAYKSKTAGKDETEILMDIAAERVRCPLLNDDEMCDLYEYRPITCRLYGIIGERCGFLKNRCSNRKRIFT